jgi:hypothetical protein
MTLEEARPYFDEALALGVEQFSFTGGEPFVNRDLIGMLSHVAQHRPALVLTNGTKPLRTRMEQVAPLRDAPHPVRFRISLDYPDAARHDANRGEGNFAYALETMRLLHTMGFGVSLARQSEPGEDRDAVDAAFREVLVGEGLPEATHIVVFPDFLTPGACPDSVPEISEQCMTTYHDAESRSRFMCNFSKMLVKLNGRVRVYACTLVDDDASYDLGGTLTEAMRARVLLRHHRCFACFSSGASCSER